MSGTRQARPDDLSALSRILRAAYAPHFASLGPNAPPLAQDTEGDIAAGACIVSGDPVNGFVVSRESGDGMLLENLAVDPVAQGKGIGRALVNAVEEKARRAGCRRVFLVTSPALEATRAFYLGMGYVEIGSDARRVLMEKLL